MFQEIRRKDRELSIEESLEVLTKGTFGILSLNGQDGNGYPYGVPVNYVYNGECIYIHGALEGEKIIRIERDNKVSFCVVGASQVLPGEFSTQYSSVIVFGQAHEVDEEEKVQALIAFLDKYSPEFKEMGIMYIEKAKQRTNVIRIHIDHLTGKSRKAST